MSAGNTSSSGTTAVRAGHEFDKVALARWMVDNVADFSGPLEVEQFSGGQSNPTFKLCTPERNYVLRRKPAGELLKGAHAVEREARVIAALADAGFPVPRVYGLCTDDQVIGSWFYVMEMVEGRIFWDATIPGVNNAQRAACFDAMNETIAKLHNLDCNAIGLGDFGRSGNYFSRQIARWSKQYLDDVEAGRDENMDRLIAWLPENIPDDGDETALIHGDFRIDNMIFHPTEPKVIAVLDWELSTLGNPLADFGYHAMMYRMPAHIVAGLKGASLPELGIPSEEKYIEAYCRRCGRSGLPAYDFYMAFNFFRLAAIFHGIKGRAIRGTASSAQAKERAKAFPDLAEIAWQQTGNA